MTKNNPIPGRPKFDINTIKVSAKLVTDWLSIPVITFYLLKVVKLPSNLIIPRTSRSSPIRSLYIIAWLERPLSRPVLLYRNSIMY